MSSIINFSSENYSGVHESVMNALIEANVGNAASYGNDQFTKEVIELFKEQFGNEIDVFFTFNGTGANNFGLGSIVERHSSVFCTDVAHLYVDESTAPEAFIGCRIYPVDSLNGKIVLDDFKAKIKRANDVHHPQPKVLSITQPTEYGTVYTLEELKAIKTVCTEHEMMLHVDGARFFNAAAYLGVSLKQLSADVGVDVLTLGGTKIGAMFGEAVIFFNNAAANQFRYNLKRSMQLASKYRFIAVQFKALLQDDLWKKIALHTNLLAKEFEEMVKGIPGIELAHPVESNAVFISMPKSWYPELQKIASFYAWNDTKNEYRFMFSFNNTEAEIKHFREKMLSCGG